MKRFANSIQDVGAVSQWTRGWDRKTTERPMAVPCENAHATIPPPKQDIAASLSTER
jgi:hypothetical protein